MKEYIAFDIGGTQIKCGIVSEIGRVLKRKTVATEIHLGGEQIIQNLYMYPKIMNEHTIAGIGISTTGIVDINKGIVTGGADHIPGYSTIPIIDRLQEILKVSVSIDNDVNCAAFGEKWNGSGREKDNFIMLTLGTGIGEQFL